MSILVKLCLAENHSISASHSKTAAFKPPRTSNCLQGKIQAHAPVSTALSPGVSPSYAGVSPAMTLSLGLVASSPKPPYHHCYSSFKTDQISVPLRRWAFLLALSSKHTQHNTQLLKYLVFQLEYE